MKGFGRFWRPVVITLGLAALVMVAALTLAACGGGTAVTDTPHASSGNGRVQPAERHGRLGDAIVLSDGVAGQLEVTALGLEFMSTVATRDSAVSNVYAVKLKLRNVGAGPIHLASVEANSVLLDAGGWAYRCPGDNPKNVLTDVDLRRPGDFRAGWVYFEAPAGGGLPTAFHYTVRSSDASAEGDTGQWKWKPIRHWLF